MIFEQPDLFSTPEPAPARGPASSDAKLQSLGKDTSLKHLIARALVNLCRHEEIRHYSDGDSIAVRYDYPVTDGDITTWIEHRTGRRQQRNVIARTRGLMEQAGWVERVASGQGDLLGFLPSRSTLDQFGL